MYGKINKQMRLNKHNLHQTQNKEQVLLLVKQKELDKVNPLDKMQQQKEQIV